MNFSIVRFAVSMILILSIVACGKKMEDDIPIKTTPNSYLKYVGEVKAKCAKFVHKNSSG